MELETDYAGMLVIGDPHLESRRPGFRKDDYPTVVLNKMAWLMDYARKNNLFPLILGDFFHLPRNNPNWLLVEAIRLFSCPCAGVYGNHDVHENEITLDDSISVIAESSGLRLLDGEYSLLVQAGEIPVLVGGTPWGGRLPDQVDSVKAEFTLWITHHDVKVPGYEEQGWIRPREIPGIDMVINGHIHRRLEPVQKGGTLWMTPGNISRRSRSDAAKVHVPSALSITFAAGEPAMEYVEVPHEPFEDVFYPEVAAQGDETSGSAFVDGLSELQARRTESGEGLKYFLQRNLNQFDSDVAEEIRNLAREVLLDGE